MDVTNKIQTKLIKILKKLKSLGIIQTFVLEMTFCQVEDSVMKSLIKVDTVLKKCLRKILSKPRKAEIRNIITELVRKKNLNNILIANEPVKNSVLVANRSNEIDALALKFPCGLCEEIFNSEQNLISHKKKHKKTKEYLCEKCGKLFYDNQNLLNHQNDLKENFVLPVKMENITKNTSNKMFQKNDDLEFLSVIQKKDEVIYKSLKSSEAARESKCSIPKNNVEVQVGNETRKKFLCVCGKIFKVLKTLKKHERIKHLGTNIQHKCITCGKCFIEKGKLNRHILSHNDYQYSCSFCLKQFSRSDTLKRHISLFHFTSRKYVCNFCEKKFSLKYNRDIHEENIHKNVNIRVQCDYCGNKFKNKTTLKTHLKTHNEKKINCTACRKSFSKKSYFEIHLKKKHSGITPDALDLVT